MKPKYRMIHDENLCIGCQACNASCRSENDVPMGVYRLQVHIETSGKIPHMKMDFQRHSCVQCENAPCVDVCPTGASFHTFDGLVHVDERTCVSCKYCILACPYEARYNNPITNAADKCTWCFDNRIAKGNDPACVSNCPTDALVFGDMNDQESDVFKISKEHYLTFPQGHLGTKPKVAFVPNKKGVNNG